LKLMGAHYLNLESEQVRGPCLGGGGGKRKTTMFLDICLTVGGGWAKKLDLWEKPPGPPRGKMRRECSAWGAHLTSK